MNEDKCDKASRKYTIIKIFGITVLVLLILVSIAGAEKSTDISDSGSNNHADSNKYVEKDMKTQDTAIEINPQDSEAWKNKGLDLVILQKPEGAIRAFDKAIEINPQYSDAWTSKGLALAELNKLDKAIKAFDKAIKINPRDSIAWDGKGLAFEGLNKHEEAIKAFDKAIKINPQDSIALKHKRALSDTEQPAYQNTGQLAYQDSQWLTSLAADELVVSNDMKYLSTALNKTDFTLDSNGFTSVSTYANTLYTDSQKAMDDSALYNVSPDLQSAKDEYQLAMVQAQSAAVYIYSGVEAYKKRNIDAGNSETEQAIPSINFFMEHSARKQKILEAYNSKN